MSQFLCLNIRHTEPLWGGPFVSSQVVVYWATIRNCTSFHVSSGKWCNWRNKCKNFVLRIHLRSGFAGRPRTKLLTGMAGHLAVAARTL
jgi:hypothetical protein